VEALGDGILDLDGEGRWLDVCESATPFAQSSALVTHAEGSASSFLNVVLDDGPTLDIFGKLFLVEEISVGFPFWQNPDFFYDK
jgi:hypothetical protein